MPQNSLFQEKALSPNDDTYTLRWAFNNDQRFLLPPSPERTEVSRQGILSKILLHCPTSAWAACNEYMVCVSMTCCLQ